MALDALRIALQGLYRLTPVALAVQGLIEELRLEWDTRNGSAPGRRSRAAAQYPAESNVLDTHRDRPSWDISDDEAAAIVRRRRAQERQNAQILQFIVAAVTQGLL